MTATKLCPRLPEEWTTGGQRRLGKACGGGLSVEVGAWPPHLPIADRRSLSSSTGVGEGRESSWNLTDADPKGLCSSARPSLDFPYWSINWTFFHYVRRILAEPLIVVRGFRIHQVEEGWAESTHTQIHCETSSAQQPRYSVEERYEGRFECEARALHIHPPQCANGGH